MELNKIEREITTAEQSLSPSAVQGVPWWGGVALQPLPLDIMYPHVAHQAPPQVVESTLSEAIYAGVSNEGNLTLAGTPAVLPPAATDNCLPHTQLDLGHGMGRAYVDPFYNGLAVAYGIQMHSHIIQQARMALPLEVTEEEPVYVNAKQYHGIMRRRQSRAKAESENKLAKSRKVDGLTILFVLNLAIQCVAQEGFGHFPL
eukprot:c24080_g1_i2 orf=304-909(+)